MARLWVRLVLVFAGLAALAAAGALDWSSQTRINSADARLRLATDASRHALIDASDLRAAQQAYVAVGQGEDFWFARVSALSKDLDDVLTVFKTHLSSAEALAAADTAAGALQDFQQVDRRAREYAHARQLSQASDVIFADGFELTQKLTGAVTQAITAEAVAHGAAAADARRREAAVLAAGGGVATLALLLLIPGRAPRPPEPSAILSEPPVAMSGKTLDELNDFRVVTRPSVQSAAPEVPSIDLAAVASLCTDLARVSDTRAVPALLGRAATILDASGIVLWIADPDGRELSPILMHGYSPRMATRLGTIARDAGNVTAAAYRTGLIQTVKGDAVSNGAIAVPLVGAGNCLGVMAVETKNGGEQREPLLAAAKIIASQLSTLVGPPSARSRAEAAG
jgi:hypothetical protein